jgi:hypothetical protein
MCPSRKYRGSVSVIERPGWSGKPIDHLRAIVAVLVFGAASSATPRVQRVDATRTSSTHTVASKLMRVTLQHNVNQRIAGRSVELSTWMPVSLLM